MSRAIEKFARRVGEAAFEILFCRERHGVDQNVELAAKALPTSPKTRATTSSRGRPTPHDGAADRLGEVAHAVLDSLALEGEGTSRAAVGEALRDRPCDRALVRNPQNERSLSLEHDGRL